MEDVVGETVRAQEGDVEAGVGALLGRIGRSPLWRRARE
jgi:hypothetical protein